MPRKIDREPAAEVSPADDEGVSLAVARAVGVAADRDALDLPALAETIDPDALDALFPSHGEPVSVEFEYAGYGVVVREDRTIEVYDSG